MSEVQKGGTFHCGRLEKIPFIRIGIIHPIAWSYPVLTAVAEITANNIIGKSIGGCIGSWPRICIGIITLGKRTADTLVTFAAPYTDSQIIFGVGSRPVGVFAFCWIRIAVCPAFKLLWRYCHVRLARQRKNRMQYVFCRRKCESIWYFQRKTSYLLQKQRCCKRGIFCKYFQCIKQIST